MNETEVASKILDSMFGHLGVPATLEIEQSLDGPCLQIRSAESRFIIGRDGDRLDDLQYLVNRILRRRLPESARIKVDCEHFRTIREDQMAAEIRGIAERVIASGTPHRMRPLNAYYRRMAYQILKDIPGIETHSPEGDERLKRITISPAESSPSVS
jgi:spoIIIJ-associated protein